MYIGISTYLFIHFPSKVFPILGGVQTRNFPPALLRTVGSCLGPLGSGGSRRDIEGWLQAQPTSPFSTGAFFIPYFIFFFSCGIPVFFLEVALGQYTSQGSVTAWRKICPLLQGECPPPAPVQDPRSPIPTTPSLIHTVLRVAGAAGSIIRLCRTGL